MRRRLIVEAEAAAVIDESESDVAADETSAGYDEAVANGTPFSAEPEVLAQFSADPVALTEAEPVSVEELILQEPGRDLRPDTITPAPDITSTGAAAAERVITPSPPTSPRAPSTAPPARRRRRAPSRCRPGVSARRAGSERDLARRDLPEHLPVAHQAALREIDGFQLVGLELLGKLRLSHAAQRIDRRRRPRVRASGWREKSLTAVSK